MNILVTGAAGFIGYHVSKRLLGDGHNVTGIDNLNDYYEVSLKEDRLKQLTDMKGFRFEKLDLADREGIAALFKKQDFERVIHLGAQAGVRYSLENPHAYADANLTGHLNILEGCRQQEVPHLVYASSSSVYGMNTKMPFQVSDSVDHPVSLYAATKKANELMSHSYAHLYSLPVTGLRFFTVYGPWGRPDMAPMLFADRILNDRPIDVYNHGKMQRDFTYIDDIVEGIVRVADIIPQRTESWTVETGSAGESSAPYRVYNIGAGRSTALLDFIEQLESSLGKEAVKNYKPMQPGDVPATWADTEDLFAAVNYRPQFSLADGIPPFVDWYRSYYGK